MRNFKAAAFALGSFIAVFGSSASAASSIDSLRMDVPRSQWSYEATVAQLNWRTGKPLVGWTKEFRQNPLRYEMVTTMLTAAKPVLLGSDDSFLRNFEYLAGVAWSDITEGPETHWGGATFGFRYNLTNPQRRVSLFGGLQGGIGAIDSSGVRYGQETDLTFAYFATVGVRTRITPSSTVNLSVLAKHVSNGWQTNPSEGIDCSGLALTFTYRPAVRR